MKDGFYGYEIMELENRIEEEYFTRTKKEVGIKILELTASEILYEVRKNGMSSIINYDAFGNFLLYSISATDEDVEATFNFFNETTKNVSFELEVRKGVVEFRPKN